MSRRRKELSKEEKNSRKKIKMDHEAISEKTAEKTPNN